MAAFVDRDENAVHEEHQAGATGALIEEQNVKNNPHDQDGAWDRLPGLLKLFQNWQALGPGSGDAHGRLILSARRFEPRVDAAGGGHTFGDRVYDFLAAVHAIACGEIFGIASLEVIADGYGAVFLHFDSLHRSNEACYRLLADGAHDHVHF